MPGLRGFTVLCVLPEHGTPTSVAFVATDPNQVVVSFDGGETLLYDLNTEQSTTALETQTKDGMLRTQRLTDQADQPYWIKNAYLFLLCRQRADQPRGQSSVGARLRNCTREPHHPFPRQQDR